MDAGTIAILIRATDQASPVMRQAAQAAQQMGPAVQSASRSASAGMAAVGTSATVASAQVNTASGNMRKAMGNVASGISPIPSGLRGVEVAAGVAAAVVVKFGADSIKAASGLAENVNKVKVVFGESAGTILRWGENAATAFGLSESAALGAAGTFGNLFVSMGMATPVASEMSRSIVQLAADLGSFNNIGTDVALEKLRAGLVGETEPLRSLGVNINAVMVQQKAMNMGLADSVAALTAADKAQASYALILEQTTTAQGDFARTSDGYANSVKIAQASFQDLQASIGAGLLPVMTALAIRTTETIAVFQSLIDVLDQLPGRGNAAEASIAGLDSALFMMTGGMSGVVEGVGWLSDAFGDGEESGFRFTTMLRGIREELGLIDPTIFEQVATAIQAETDALSQSSTEYERYTTGQAQAENAALGYASALSRQAEAAGEANERNSEFFHSVELGNSVLAALGNAAESAWEQQQKLNTGWTEANEAVGFWETNLSNAEKALKILDDEMTENGRLTDEQQFQYDRLTEATGRYAGGVEDTEGAVVEAAVAQAEFIKQQDLLKGMLDDGTISAADYASKMADITAESDPAASAAYNMSAAQQTVADTLVIVIDKIQGMLEKLGLIPAEKKTDISTPGVEDAKTNIGLLGEGIGALPSSFTITANLNADPFYSALEGIAAMIPHSPAQAGPLAFTPDWSWLTAGADADMLPGIEEAARKIVDVIASEAAPYEEALGLLSGATGEQVNLMIAELERLQAALIVQLATAFLEGTDPTGIEANLAVIEQLLASLADRAVATAETIVRAGKSIGMAVAGAAAVAESATADAASAVSSSGPDSVYRGSGQGLGGGYNPGVEAMYPDGVISRASDDPNWRPASWRGRPAENGPRDGSTLTQADLDGIADAVERGAARGTSSGFSGWQVPLGGRR